MARYPNITPLGKITITTAGTTILLSVNCGPLSGAVGGTQTSPPFPGSALRQIRLTNTAAAAGSNVYLLPRGSTASSNPANIIAIILPQQTISIPEGVMAASGFVPENYCLDIDGAGPAIVYGYGVTG